MIKADGEEFWIEGEKEEIIQEFGGICLTFLHNGFSIDDLVDIVNQSKGIYEECKDEIEDIED